MPCHPFVQSYHAHKTVNKTRTSPPFPCGYPKLALMKQKDHVQLRTIMVSKYRQISIDTGGCTRLFGRWVGGRGLRAHRSPQCSPPCLEPPASWCRAGSPCRLSVHLGCFKLATRRFNSWFSFLLFKMAAGQDRRAGEGRHPPSVSIKPIKNAHTPATKYQPNLSTTFSFQSPWKKRCLICRCQA